ncbi:MAG: response regulator [Vicinamibacteria bacterium]
MSDPVATVLIVDDDVQNHRPLEAVLRAGGFLTRTAKNGIEALASVKSQPPDLVLLDFNMPGMDGLEVARTLKADPTTSAIPIIMVTGQSDRSVRLACLDAGAEDFVSKPVDRAELWLRVRNLLRLKSLTNFFHNHSVILEQQVQERTADLQSSLREREVLLKEVHHRVKNNLQIMISFLRLESRRTNHEPTRSVLTDMENRIRAMAALHEALYRSSNFNDIDLRSYIEQVTRNLKLSMGKSADRIRFNLDLVSVNVRLDEAVPCGLIVNELVSNTVKHAFPAERPGEVRVELTRTGESGLRLRVSDDGVGLPADLSARRGASLGLQLVSDLARQLGGELKIGEGPEAVFEVTMAPDPIPQPEQTGARRRSQEIARRI